MNRAPLLLAGLAILAVGCATRGSVRQLQTDVGTLRSEVTALREAREQLTHEMARTVAELKALEERIRPLSASVGEAAAALAPLRSRVEAAEEALKSLRAELATLAAAAKPPPEPSRESAVAPAAEAAYASALATFRAGEHGQAVLEFLDFLAKHPKHLMAPSAQYWIGEAYYLQHDCRQALVEFRKALDYRGPNDKTPDALLRIGLCYATLRERARARETWQRLVREHPGSEAAARARALLRSPRASTLP